MAEDIPRSRHLDDVSFQTAIARTSLAEPGEWERVAALDLTPELRTLFEHTGAFLVREYVLHHSYVDPKKHAAAIVWLEEKEGEQKRAQRRQRIWAVIAAIVGAGSLTVALWQTFRTGG